ncbi:hypothetical protein R6Q59_013349 [Mikania micrantha]
MPGSIQVSVLDFKELPTSSNSVKLSLGKVEHGAWEMGTFSFPLMNLRDNLIITIQDSEGNQVSQSGIRTMSIIEKGTWDDVFPIEGGGLIHMKLQFFLSEEERNRIRLMRELAMKKKQVEILGSRHEVSDVLSASSSQDFQKGGVNIDISLKASDTCDGIKEESFQRPLFTNVTDRKEETSLSHAKQEIEQKPKYSDNLVENLNEETLKEDILNDVKEISVEMTSNKKNSILLQEAEAAEKLLEDTETRDFLKNNDVIKSKPLSNLVEKLGKQILEENSPTVLKKMSKESKVPPFSKETEVNTYKRSEIQLQETDSQKKLQDSSSRDVVSSRLTVSEKIKSFSPKLAGEMDKQGSPEKTPQNIKKMISVFESTISQDRVPLKVASTKPYRLGTSGLVKDFHDKSESSLKNSEKSISSQSSSRLRNSFSMGDLRKNLSDIITKGDHVESDNNFVERRENMQSKGYNSKDAEKMGKEALHDEENLRKSPHEGVENEKEGIVGRKTSKDNVDYLSQDRSGQWTFLDEKQQICMTAEGEKAISLSSDCKTEAKGHEEKIVASVSEIVAKGKEIESPESADVESSNGSFGQAMKIALVVGFGVLVYIFRQRESGKGKKKENKYTLRNQVLMNKRGGSIEEQGRRRIGVSRLS